MIFRYRRGLSLRFLIQQLEILKMIKKNIHIIRIQKTSHGSFVFSFIFIFCFVLFFFFPALRCDCECLITCKGISHLFHFSFNSSGLFLPWIWIFVRLKTFFFWYCGGLLRVWALALLLYWGPRVCSKGVGTGLVWVAP